MKKTPFKIKPEQTRERMPKFIWLQSEFFVVGCLRGKKDEKKISEILSPLTTTKPNIDNLL